MALTYASIPYWDCAILPTTWVKGSRDMTASFRTETDSLGEVQVPNDKLWGAQTQRSLVHFSIGDDLIPREMITAYAILKKAAALTNHEGGRLPQEKSSLIVKVCDEILAGQHHDMFPLHVWMTGSGTQFNMNMNEVISNRCAQLAGFPLGSKKPIHPNDDVNMSQSSNDSFPSAMYMAAAIAVTGQLIPALSNLRESLDKKSKAWMDVVKIGRTHLQDATPLTVGQEFSGYVGMLDDDLTRMNDALKGVYCLALGGTAVGTGINAAPGFAQAVAKQIAKLTQLPFISAPNKFTVQGSHDALVQLSATLKTLAVSLYKIANDIRLLSCGPRAGFYELLIPANEPGSSIMPGKVNPTQCEAMTMAAVQVMANDVAVTFGGAGGYLEMNVYKPLIIFNITKSIRVLTDTMKNFHEFLVEGMQLNEKKIASYVERSLMLVTALSPIIGYDKASQIAHYALDHDLSLKEAALKLNFISSEEFDKAMDPKKMIHPIE
ncbi:fumarate hydratase [Legionella maceachernii]|uniref:Fumarate hydratase class II n=2 Tax=Legionellaceae TaxID=444 RepID=A0A0W0VVJ6_9GAMM|nr:fumarate hydratase [Legionella maceachernii]SKA23046.1 fumarase, class II [Legionella maceachernii]SUO98700.1 Fumarate hydratase class II [Legionella maceachernii]